MMIVILIHGSICLILIIIILIQAGRGGGLVEGFQGVESMFGTKTNSFLTRATTILAVSFFLTCILLAFLSVRQSRSLLSNVNTKTVTRHETPKEKTAGQSTAETPKAAPKETVTATPAPAGQPQASPKQEQKTEAPKAE